MFWPKTATAAVDERTTFWKLLTSVVVVSEIFSNDSILSKRDFNSEFSVCNSSFVSDSSCTALNRKEGQGKELN